MLLLFFPPFAKSRTDGRKRKFSFVGKKNEEKLAHAFLHLLYKNALLLKYTNNNNV